jgi:hypothetical protein
MIETGRNDVSLAAELTAKVNEPNQRNGIIVSLRAEGTYGMGNMILAFIISLGLVGAGLGWIVAGPNSALCITIGIASIVVGAISVLNELRLHRGWQ